MPRNTSGLKPPWKKGDPSPNPGGRPKKRPITDEYFALSDQPIPEKLRKKLEKAMGIVLQAGITWSQTQAIRRYLEAVGEMMEEGGTKAAKEIRESIEGKAPQRLEISGPERKEITIAVRFTNKR